MLNPEPKQMAHSLTERHNKCCQASDASNFFTLKAAIMENITILIKQEII